MKDLLIETLTPLGYPIFQQGSLGKDEAYPDSFFTFWNGDTVGDEFYDNEEHSVIWSFDLNFYTNDPEILNTKLLEAKELLKIAGFIVSGKGYDVPSDEITHVGRGISILKVDKGGIQNA